MVSCRKMGARTSVRGVKGDSGCVFVGGIDMLWFLKGRAYPIGVDMGRDSLKLAQLGNNGKGIHLIAGGSENRPADVEPGSGDWQRWAIEAIRRLIAKGRFLAAVMLI